jgi:trigger factor
LPENAKDLSREEKEQEVIKALLESVEVTVPKLLIDEEANSRLSQLLERLEKLGLTLESYLASIKKTATSLRQEYEEQAKRGIALDIILNEVAGRENIKVDDAQIDAAINARSSDPALAESLKTPEQRRLITSIMRRRAALDSLVSLL